MGITPSTWGFPFHTLWMETFDGDFRHPCPDRIHGPGRAAQAVWAASLSPACPQLPRYQTALGPPQAGGPTARCPALVYPYDRDMRALRYHGRNDVRLEQVPEPQTGPGQVKIRPAFTGICGSDLHFYLDGPMPPAPTADRPHPVSQECLPVVFGHEFSGVVTELGEGVGGLAVGDAVCVEPLLVDGTCEFCLAGRYNLCRSMGFVGVSGGGGGLADYVVVDARWVHRVGTIPLEQAALIEPLAIAVHGVRRSGAQSGDTVLIGGAGPIGLLSAAVARALGCTVIVTEVSAARKQVAADAGVADHVLDPNDQPVAPEARRLTGGRGVDVAIECSGAPAVLDTLLSALRPGGVAQILAIYPGPAPVDLGKVVVKELDVRGAIGYAGDHAEAIGLVQDGRVDLRPFITDIIPVTEYVTGGIERLQHHNDSAVKLLVRM